MSSASIADLERLLQGIRFRPPPVPAFWRPRTMSLFSGGVAVACLFLLIFVFWSAALRLVP